MPHMLTLRAMNMYPSMPHDLPQLETYHSVQSLVTTFTTLDSNNIRIYWKVKQVVLKQN